MYCVPAGHRAYSQGPDPPAPQKTPVLQPAFLEEVSEWNETPPIRVQPVRPVAARSVGKGYISHGPSWEQ